MESQYGIGITNRYAMFLDNEDDPADVLKAEVKDDKKKGKIAEKENRGKVSGGGGASAGGESAPGQKPVSTTAPAPRKGIQDSNKPRTDVNRASNKPAPNAGNVGRPNRPPRTEGQGQGQRSVRANDDDREDRNNRRNLTRDESGREPRPEGDFNRGGPRRGGGGGGGGGQFGNRPRGAPSGRGRGPPGTGVPERKREFDRKSGSDKSGVKPIDKRDGAGSHNWGNYKDDLQGAENPGNAEEPAKEEAEAQPTEATESTEEKGEQNDVENVEPAVEEGPKTMTLEEWKALQQPREKPVFNLRKAGEGEDQTQWKKMILKKKEKPGSGDDEEYEEEEHYEVLQRAGRQKQILDIDFHFTDSRRGGPGGGRGGRGGPRGGGGREGGGRDRDRDGGREGSGRDRDREGGPPGERGERRGPRPPRNPTGPSSGPPAPGGFNKNPRSNRFGNAPRSQAAPKVDDVNDFPSLG